MASKFTRLLADSRRALFAMLGLLTVIWTVQLVNWADDYGLSYDYGLAARRVDELPDMFTMPFLHFGWDHIEANSWPLFAFGFLSAYRGMRKFLWTTLMITVVGGLTVWLFERPEAVTAGASGLVYGYFGYVVLRGFLDRNLLDAVIGIAIGVLYSALLVGVLPSAQGVSWLGHLGGLIGGLAAAWFFRNRAARPAAAGGSAPGTARTRAADRPAADTPGSRSALLKELDDLGI
ncbi:rhomboid family intramembrane serine protease [Kitasatospora sp. NPDC054939]